MMLGNGLHRGIVTSTISEIRGALNLAKNGELDECLYGVPIFYGALSQLHTLSKSIGILLMIDNEQQLDILESYAANTPGTIGPWSVFVKIDVGSSRAGLTARSPYLLKLIQRIESSPAATIRGFYCHAGHSYASRTENDTLQVLQAEIDGVVHAAKYLNDRGPGRRTILSIGATPTAHVVSKLQATLPPDMTLELHAGCYPANDLQQVSTSLVTPDQQAIRILADVCSVYPERNEALINAGTVALSKETSDFPGYATVVDNPGWCVARIWQEHGVLGLTEAHQTKRIGQHLGSRASVDKVEDFLKVGDKVLLFVQHACITAAQHFVYFVVDEHDVVRETWVPWKGW